MKAIAFTGHRPNKLNGWTPNENLALLTEVRNKVLHYARHEGYDTFIQGCALGTDLWSALVVIKLRRRHKDLSHIKLISAVPCLNHKSKWNEESQKLWDYVIKNSDEVVYVSEEEYTPKCMQIRNEWMVDRADKLIAVWDGTRGGTGSCVEYALKKKKTIDRIDPREYK